ncbi:MAG: hypothetical protein AAFN78_07235 [Pseudomonadota bacterium]
MASWRKELGWRLRQTTLAPLVAGLFVMLTAWVVSIHGIVSWKSAIPMLGMSSASTTRAFFAWG